MTTMIPPTVFTQITQINSSPETIAALLNEAENTYSGGPKRSNQKRVYPFWKACRVCGAIYSVADSTEYNHNRYCSKACGKTVLSNQPHMRNQQHRRSGAVIACPVCGKEVYKPAAWLRKGQQHFCSHSCRGKAVTGPILTANKFDRTGMKFPDSGMKGAANPAWKGGVTYFKKHGNYMGVKYIRCPAEYLSMARKDGYVMEHRVLVAQAIGRPLLRVEVVHHIDHNPANNDLSNLQLFASNRDHKLYEHHGSPLPIWQL